MARVFISHAAPDRGLAREVFGWLTSERHELFYDQDLSAGLALGEHWQARLFERLRWADAVVCLVTATYVASPWCSAEIGIAIARGSRLMPVLAEPGVTHPLLRGIHHTDYATDPSQARAALRAALVAVDNVGGRGWADNTSPFPGLRAFDREMHAVFFGRRQEVQQLVELLRSPAERDGHRLLVITGPSGCGKSSLVRAGLLPEIADEPDWWALPAIRPGLDPIAAVAAELTAAARAMGLPWSLTHVKSRLTGPDAADVFVEFLLTVPGTRRRHMLVIMDQLEELLTRTPEPGQSALAGLIERIGDGPVAVVGTLRSEYLAPLLANENLRRVPIRTFSVRPLAPEALPDVIKGPADLAGIEVEPELMSRLVADTGTGEALPLLAFTLQQLAAGVPRGGRLSLQHYESLGGVQGALTSQADAALQAASTVPARPPERVIAELLRLVTVDEEGRPIRNRVALVDLPEGTRKEFEAFTARRLLTTDIENDVVVIAVAHEAFLSVWHPLREAITAAGAALRARRAVEQAAKEWEEVGRPQNRLWERGRLAAARTDLQGPNRESRRASRFTERSGGPKPRRAGLIPTGLNGIRVDLSHGAHGFLRASLRADRLRRTRAYTILSGLLVLAVIAAITATAFRQQAISQRDLTLVDLLTAEADQVRADDPGLATQLGLVAYQINPATGAAPLLASQGRSGAFDHGEPALDLAQHADGDLIAISTGTAIRLWNTAGRAFSTIPELSTGPVAIGSHRNLLVAAVGTNSASPAGAEDPRDVLEAPRDQIRVWNIADPAHPTEYATVPSGHSSVIALALSADERILAAASSDGALQQWDLTDPQQPAQLASLTTDGPRIDSLTFAPTGRLLASSGGEHTVRLWDLTDPNHPTQFPGFQGSTTDIDTTQPAMRHRLAFSDDGRLLATPGNSNDYSEYPQIWQVQDPRNPHLLTAEPRSSSSDHIVALTFDGTDKLLVSYEHSTLQTWQYATDKEPGKNLDELSHLGSYDEGFGGRVLVGPQSSKVLHAGSTGVRIWDLANPEQPGALVSAQGANGLSGAQLATNVAGRPLLADTAYQPFIRLWDLSIPTEPTNLAVYRSLNPEGTGLDILAKSGAVAMSPDGAILAGSEIADGKPLVTLRRTTAPTDPPVARITDLDNGAIALSLTGHVLAVVDNVNFEPERQGTPSLKLYDVDDPAHPRRVATLPTPEIYRVSNSPDGRLLTAFTATTLLAWDITDPHNPQALPSRRLGLNTLFTQGSFSSDGKLLVTSAGAAGIELWPVQNDRIIDPPIVVQHTRGSAMAFSADARTLGIASNTDPTVTIALWDISDPTTPINRGTWSTTRYTLGTSLIFGGDGNILVVATDSGVDLWDVDPTRVSRRVCDTVGDVITEAQWARYVPNLPYDPPCPTG